MAKITILLIALSLQVSANIYAQQQVTLNVKNATLVDVLSSIREQTGYLYLMRSANSKLAKPVTINLKSTPLETALQQIFLNQPFTFELQQPNMIVIKVKQQPEKKTPVQPEEERQKEIKGTVKDEHGNPLPGATVILKDQNNWITITDEEGRFTFKNAPSQGTILARMIGRETKEIKYKDGAEISFVLKEVNMNMDEVQIIAYGQVSKKYSTSNIATVKAEDIARQPVSNPLLALEGRVPGLYIQQQSGVTANPVKVTLQGINSLKNNSDPFYVIDGVPYSPQFTDYSLMAGAINGAGGSSFNFINPADIESVTILKDADATAIYGSRAANGAILITTKKGKTGKTKIDVNFQNGWGKITRKMDLLNTQQYLEIRKEAYVNAGLPVPDASTSPDGSNYELTVWDQNRYTDWQKVLVGGTAKYTNIQASISGGNANTQFMASYGYLRETTVYPGDLADEKGNVHLNLNHQSNDRKFKYTLSTTYLQDLNRLNGIDLMGKAIQLPPNAPALYKADGTLNWEPYPNNPKRYSFNNPLAFVEQKYKGNTNNIIANNLLSYEVIPGLELKASAGFNRLQAIETNVTPLTYFKPDAFNKTRSARFLNKSITSWIIEPQITYSKNTKFGNFETLLGSTFQESVNDVLSQTGTGQPNDGQLENLSAASNIVINSVFKTDYKYNAIFGRINYRLMDKYIVNLNMRRDGSSRFGDQNHFHNFYSVGGAWLFGEETLIKHAITWLSSGKFRVNYGTTGNDQITDYRYLSLLGNYNLAQIPYLQATGLYPISIANPSLQWEETRKLNFGLDLGFLNNNILLNLNYFRNRSSNQLLRYVVPSTTGFDFIDRNFPANVQNSGLEAMLDITVLKKRNFTWQSSFNITLPKNKLIEFPGLESSSYSSQYMIGQSTNIMKLYQYAGVNATTGLYQFVTSKGELTSDPSPTTDRTQIIDLNPKFYGGWNNTFQYKNFELDFLFQFVKKNAANYKFGNYPGFEINQPSLVLDRWKKPGDVANVQKISQGDDVFTPFDAVGGSDASYSDASFIRLKNASLSYILPTSFMNKLHLSRARIYAQGQNLLTITNYKGTDPEIAVVGTLPPLRMFSLGLQLTF